MAILPPIFRLRWQMNLSSCPILCRYWFLSILVHFMMSFYPPRCRETVAPNLILRHGVGVALDEWSFFYKNDRNHQERSHRSEKEESGRLVPPSQGVLGNVLIWTTEYNVISVVQMNNSSNSGISNSYPPLNIDLYSAFKRGLKIC